MTPRLTVLTVLCPVILLATAAFAKPDPVAGPQLQRLVAGKTVTFSDGGRATYGRNGAYAYTGSAPSKRGTWYVGGDTMRNRVCVSFSTEGGGSYGCVRFIPSSDPSGYSMIDIGGYTHHVESIH